MPNFFKGLEANLPAIWIDAETIFVTTDTGKIYISTGEGKPLKQVGFKTLDKDITYYVDATNGNDSDTGLTAASPFKTITKAIEVLSSTQIINCNITVDIAPGTYNETVTLKGLMGKGNISLLGAADISGVANYYIKEIYNMLYKSNITTVISGFTVDTYYGRISPNDIIVLPVIADQTSGETGA